MHETHISLVKTPSSLQQYLHSLFLSSSHTPWKHLYLASVPLLSGASASAVSPVSILLKWTWAKISYAHSQTSAGRSSAAPLVPFHTQPETAPLPARVCPSKSYTPFVMDARQNGLMKSCVSFHQPMGTDAMIVDIRSKARKMWSSGNGICCNMRGAWRL